MRLVSITVENYRSITKAHKIRLGQLTTLVGPNNEGKSNILRALVTAMRVLTGERHLAPLGGLRFARALRSTYRNEYQWERDFPVHLQPLRADGESVIVLEFELTDAEIEQFRDAIGSTLNGTLPLRIALGPHGEYAITVKKPGIGGKTLSTKSPMVAAFISDRLDFQHIPAVRTATSSEDIVRNLVERELRRLEEDPQYQEAVGRIAELQQPTLNRISANIRDTLVGFLPAVKGVHVQIRSDDRAAALRRSYDVVVDDGTPTLLRYKGDGVQSLAALGLMRHISEEAAQGKSLVIAIEEPESHLHPSAIHDLHAVISELSSRHQIVLTTHCPLFVDRNTPSNNVIVCAQKAKPAKNIQEVRDVLGVRASDNLQHADLVLLVEGEDDRVALIALLAAASPQMSKLLRNGALALDSLAGSSNLAYKVGLVRDALCMVHAFLDNDSASKTAYDKARTAGLLSDAQVTFAIVPGLKESEIEDMYDPAAYSPLLLNKHGVGLDSAAFKGTAKWSSRLSSAFKSQGKQWDDRVEREVKQAVAEAVASSPARFLHPKRREAFDALLSALEARVAPH